jgi:hypothetical protein
MKNKKHQIPVVRRTNDEIQAAPVQLGTRVESRPLLPLPTPPDTENKPLPPIVRRPDDLQTPVFNDPLHQNQEAGFKYAPLQQQRQPESVQNTETPAPTMTPTPAPTVSRNPIAERRAQLEAENAQYSQPTEKSKDSRLHSGFEGAMRGLAEYFNPSLGIVRNWDEFFARLAGVGGKFAGGMINDKWDEEDERLRKLDENKKQLGELDEREKRETDTLYRNKQMENMERDDKRASEQFNVSQQNKFLLEQRRFENRMSQMDKQASIEGNKWKKDIDEQGRVWKLYNDGRREAMPDPDDPSRQDIDPNFKTYEVYSPVSGTKVTLRGDKLFAGESQSSNANTSIANRDLEDDDKYKAKIAEFDGEIAGITSKIQSKQSELAKVPDPPQTKEDFDKRERLTKEIGDLQGDLQKQQTIKKNYPKPVKRQQNPTPGVVSAVSEDVFRERLKANNIPPDKWDAIIQKAKADKVIK